MKISFRAMKILTIILPLMSLMVAAYIVNNEYARRDRLAREIKQARREIVRIVGHMPEERD